ncbi:type II toxin-antitoxin system RelE/ParE family toxin [Candidatus Saccharibacteria bacterium]|nr:type II toxin-antitoxin system RelE/ParE family toxin [Candidatus Saccharibacteria bacterium]
MNWQIEFKETARKDLEKLNPVVRSRIGEKIKFFLAQPNPLSYAAKLTDKRSGQYRWRVGNYRILFDAGNKKISVLAVDHRREVYRK